jgi:hypothetical protein
MTDQEIAQALMDLIRDDAQRPPEEQLRDLIAAGVIDTQGRVLLGGSSMPRSDQATAKPEVPNHGPPTRKAVGT